MNFKSLPELLDYFKEEQTGVKYFENIRWAGNPVCPFCGKDKPGITKRGYKCSNKECYKKFTVKVGTVFQGSKIPFRIWFAAIYLCNGHKKGISSMQLSRDLNITQKTAWFVLHRVRELLRGSAPEMLEGNSPIEIDEAHIGGKEENRHKSKKRYKDTDLANDGTVYNKKKVVVGIVERGGKIIVKHIPAPKAEHILPVIAQVVPKGAQVMTDESLVYTNLYKHYEHSTVMHSAFVYVEGKTHTNTVENFWSVLKRGLTGTYHAVSEKHLERYLNEFSSRYNNRDTNVFERFEEILKNAEGSLLYKNLIAKK